MNVKIKDEEQPKKFYPFTLEIRIESLEELANLWCRLNCDMLTIQERNKGYRSENLMQFASVSNTMLWEIINEKANQFEIGDKFS